MSGRGRQVEEAEEDEEEGDDMVAFLEDPPTEHTSRMLTRRVFPSKVGGRPAWLVPKHLPGGAGAPGAGESAAAAPSPSSSSSSSKKGKGSGAADKAAAAAAAAASGEPLGCKKCSRPLRFLLQVYASRGEVRPGAFHRVLHLFVCTSCQPNEVRIFRAQLPWENKFYSGEPPDAEAIARELREAGDADDELDELWCLTCGMPRGKALSEEEGGGAASSQRDCAECLRRRRNGDPPTIFQEREMTTVEADYPEEDEEEAAASSSKGPKKGDGDSGETEEDDDVEEVYTDGVAKEKGLDRDLVAEAEGVIEAARKKGASAEVLKRLEEYKAKVAENAENAIDASEQAVFDEYSKKEGEHDPVFSKFNRYAHANNGHILRYRFGGQPLWYCGPGQLEGEPPRCENCGGPRCFELQVQPQLISMLYGTTPIAERLEFGSIFCFSCEESCDAPSSRPYLEEFAFVQGEPRDAWLPKA